MTSRVISALIIAAVITAVCLTSVLYTSNFSDDVKRIVNEIESDKKDSKELISDVSEKWKKYSEMAAWYIEHDELEKVTVLVERLKETKNECDYIFRIDCLEIELAMDHLDESQKADLNNIF